VNGGIISFGYYFFGLGVIILGGFFFDERVIAIAYIAAKLYVIYKGVLRILNQSFFNDLKDIDMCNKVDYLATLAGIILLIATFMFPIAFQEFFIDKKISPNPYWVALLGITGFIISPFTSFTSKAMLEKKDKAYAIITILGLLVSFIVCVTCYFLNTDETGLLISLIAGELTCVIGLIKISGSVNLIKKRFYFILRVLPLVLIPYGVKYFAGDTTITMIVSLIVFGIIALITNMKSFRLELSDK